MVLIHRKYIILLVTVLLLVFNLPTMAENSNVVKEKIPTAVVGQSVEIPLEFKDDRGKCVALGEGYKNINIDSYVIQKPEGARVDVDEEVGYASKLKNTGCTEVKISSDRIGLVKVQMVITVKDYNDSNIVYMSELVAKFVPEINEDLGAKTITMFIGEKGYVQDNETKAAPIAPFIKEGYIYVPVRALADGFGAEIGWDSASKTITLTREDMVVKITNEAKNITKVIDGMITVVEAETAPYIKEGIAVVPYRVLGEAFGYKVSYDEQNKAISYTR